MLNCKNKFYSSFLIVIFLFFLFFELPLVLSEEAIETINIAEQMGLSKTITGSGVEYSNLGKEEGARVIFTKKNGNLIIGENKYGDIIPQSESGRPTYIELDEKGAISKADLTTSKETSLVFNGKEYLLPANSRIIYNEGVIEIIAKKGDNIGISQSFKDGTGATYKQKVNFEMVGGRIKIENLEKNFVMQGENFKINGNEIKGFRASSGKVSVSSSGEINKIWKGTEANILGISHRTLNNDLNVYYDKNFDFLQHKGENYFNYGVGKVRMGGEGYESIFKKGNPLIGKDSSKPFFVSMDMRGGEVQVDLTGIHVENGPLEIVNGRNRIGYYEKNGQTQYKLKLEDCLSVDSCTPLGGLNLNDGGLIQYSKEGVPFRMDDVSRVYNSQDKITFNIDKNDVRTYSLDQSKLYVLVKKGDVGGTMASAGMDSDSEWGHAGIMIYDYKNKEWIISEVVADGVQNVKDIKYTYFVPEPGFPSKLDGVYEVQTKIDPDKALEFARKGQGSPFGAYPPWVYKLHSSFTGENKMSYICSEWTNQVVIHGSPISESLDTSVGISRGNSSLPVTVFQNVVLSGSGYTLAKELVDSKKVKEIFPVTDKK